MAELKTTTEPKTAAAPIPATTHTSAPQKKKAPGLSFRRLFTKPGVSPYNEVEWELRNAQITDSQGGMIFEQKNVEVPKDWSMTATNIVASKYLHGKLNTPERETSVRQLIHRICRTIADCAKAVASLNVMIVAQFIAGAAWGCMMMSAISAALWIGATGAEGKVTGLVFSALALATCARMSAVAGGLSQLYGEGPSPL